MNDSLSTKIAMGFAITAQAVFWWCSSHIALRQYGCSISSKQIEVESED